MRASIILALACIGSALAAGAAEAEETGCDYDVHVFERHGIKVEAQVTCLGEVGSFVALPGAAYLSGDSGPVIGTASGAAALILFRHRANLRRLRAGTERRLGRRAGPSAP